MLATKSGRETQADKTWIPSMVHPIKGHTCCAEVTHVGTELVDTRAVFVAIVT